MKKIIRLTESDLHRLVKETVKKFLSEDKNSEMESDYEKYGAGYGKPKYFQGISDDEWNKQTKDDYEKEFDEFADEYLNTPNASKDFKAFPRMSVVRNHDYDPLSNGTAKRKRENKLANLKNNNFSKYNDYDITQLIKRYEQLCHNPKYRINKQLKGEANEILKQIEEYIKNERQDLINQYNLFLDDVYNSGNYIVIEPDSNSIFKTPSYTEKDKQDNVRPIPSMVKYALQYLK